MQSSQTRPGIPQFHFLLQCKRYRVLPLCLLSVSEEVGLVVCLFVVSQRKPLEESVAEESVVVGFAGGNVDRLENGWINTVG